MSVRTQGSTIRLEGSCGVEDAEALLVALQETDSPSVDLSTVTHLHLAVAQVLAAAQPAIGAPPQAGFVRDILLPAIATATKQTIS
ncbi:hypothetical protein ACFSCW_11170 [Sphingomonas tabacisoli]|uniref:STAS domain-containing protein n=1 Tax=Sphingomonas tabacisoli TaxID=2249466 RepID=A0ABW4I671_9SPHN